MRNEQEMMDLILNTAECDVRIRAVIMNGSRANPNAKKDFFQDYDIVYVLKDIDSFINNHSWIDIFGEIMIMQMPKRTDGGFTYLMQFMDGNRIDLSLIPIEKADELITRDSQSILLIDKDDIIEPFAPASDADYIIKKPTEEMFDHCCNEFWWICPYVAKGIWRDELPYAMYMYDRFARDMLFDMIEWYIGVKTNFTVSSGKCGKYFKDYLEPELWNMFVRTYSDADYDNLWKALFTAGDLFRIIGQNVAEYFGYQYPYGDDERVTAHLKHVMNLPRDAKEMY